MLGILLTWITVGLKLKENYFLTEKVSAQGKTTF